MYGLRGVLEGSPDLELFKSKSLGYAIEQTTVAAGPSTIPTSSFLSASGRMVKAESGDTTQTR